MRGAEGFTLVEVLAVLVIIGAVTAVSCMAIPIF
jgi:prepilin-type N-terminal cleavage/methylation domain-containing protein